MINVGAPMSANACTVRRTSVVLMPFARAWSAAAWITGPSISGSL